jgi:hypothetical protein
MSAVGFIASSTFGLDLLRSLLAKFSQLKLQWCKFYTVVQITRLHPPGRPSPTSSLGENDVATRERLVVPALGAEIAESPVLMFGRPIRDIP